MIETEAKIRITDEDFERLKKELNNPSFFIQENLIYRIPGGMIRIRKEKRKNFLTFKQPSVGDFKSMNEIETEIKDSKKIREILENLGLKNPFFYKKKRANSSIEDCIVSLDILPNGEFYIEIEGSTEKIRLIMGKLGLNNKEIERRSYQEILNVQKHR